MRAMAGAGTIGDVLSITHTEPIGHAHFAHSFVRGQWSQEAESTFTLMSKCGPYSSLLSANLYFSSVLVRARLSAA